MGHIILVKIKEVKNKYGLMLGGKKKKKNVST